MYQHIRLITERKLRSLISFYFLDRHFIIQNFIGLQKKKTKKLNAKLNIKAIPQTFKPSTKNDVL